MKLKVKCEGIRKYESDGKLREDLTFVKCDSILNISTPNITVSITTGDNDYINKFQKDKIYYLLISEENIEGHILKIN